LGDSSHPRRASTRYAGSEIWNRVNLWNYQMSYEFYVLGFLLAMVSGLGVVLTIDWIRDAVRYRARRKSLSPWMK